MMVVAGAFSVGCTSISSQLCHHTIEETLSQHLGASQGRVRTVVAEQPVC